MELSQKDIKFLTILNETRLSGGKMPKKYFDEINEKFVFSNEEINNAAKKFVKIGLLSIIAAGGDEYVYFHTDKVIKSELNMDLIKIKH